LVLEACIEAHYRGSPLRKGQNEENEASESDWSLDTSGSQALQGRLHSLSSFADKTMTRRSDAAGFFFPEHQTDGCVGQGVETHKKVSA
jgi:hypothetical protein